MLFNDLLGVHGIAASDVALCLHKPSDMHSRRALVHLLEHDRAAFEAYQSTHAAGPEATVRTRRVFASFLMTEAGALAFVDLYDRASLGQQTADDLMADADFARMLDAVDGHLRTPRESAQVLAGRERFQLTPRSELADLSRRLIVRDPGGRAYVRRADTTALEVIEVQREARIAPPMPSWDALVLDAQDMRILPDDWAMCLSQWRGIYLITDTSDGARYVGAAYGADNLLGRWRVHVAGEFGVTAELSTRRTDGFRFSILELVAPTATIEEVTAREQSWMVRLHTKQYGLNA